MPSLTARLLVVALVVAAIAGAVTTGALSSVSATRDATISVATDDDALLALRDGHPNSGIVEQESNGVLTIRFDRHGADGVNWDFVTTLGDATLYRIHPWLPIVVIDALAALGFAIVALALVGWGPVRVDTGGRTPLSVRLRRRFR